MSRNVACLVAGALVSASACAQYVGTVKKDNPKAPELRAVAVLEYTGDPGKPKAARLVPVSIFDGERLNDASIYMARPQPIAVAGEVEYELKKDGKPFGLFDIKNAGQEQGSWVGYGEWKPLEKPKTDAKPVLDPGAEEDDDKPVLHRKQHTDEGATSASSASKDAPADDPDRPKLHKKDDSGSTTADSGASTAPTEAPDADQPTLHRHSGTAESSGEEHGKKHKKQEDVARVESLSSVSDPDRPRLQRGKSNAESLKVTPSLMGLPADMKQTIAVSDAQAHSEHPFAFSWPNPDEADKMKAQLEDAARAALGLDQPPASAPKAQARPALRRGTKTKMIAPKSDEQPAQPTELHDEQFRAFELTYGGGATLVFTANTGGPLAQEKFVTIIAQPDLYGNVNVLFKHVTSGTHLDDDPQMRIIDAVDAQADNRGDLLFELRGTTQRTFALYRVARGRAEKLFTGGGGEYGSVSE